MRADIVTGAVFPDYELTDHAGKRRKLSDLQGPDPMVLVLSGEDSARRIVARPRVWSNFITRWKSVTPGSSPSVPTTCFWRMSTDGVGAHWLFNRIRDERFKRISTSPSIRIPSTIRWSPCHRPRTWSRYIQIYNGYWFFGRPPLKSFGKDLRAVLKKCRPDWDITTPELKAAWEQVNVIAFSLWRQDLRAGVSGAKVNGDRAPVLSARSFFGLAGLTECLKKRDMVFRGRIWISTQLLEFGWL